MVTLSVKTNYSHFSTFFAILFDFTKEGKSTGRIKIKSVCHHGQKLLLLAKLPLAKKTPKNNGFLVVSGAHTDEISLLKAFLHKCGRVGISSKQLKEIKQDKGMYATFPKSQKNT